ncbi:MAG TPA: hypothetical protein VG248_19055 [Caulobacteraceae bacterium]|jgi:hypothetical protein|nr:hypothetical protein [Caulobacteraceae bacterium]
MKRTVSALYESRDEAERVVQALKSAGLGEDVDICDKEGSTSAGLHREEGHHGWLSKLFGGHRDAHVYGEALRRGHVLVSAKVEETNETRAAQILDSAALDVSDRERAWTADGWQAPADGAAATQAQNEERSSAQDDAEAAAIDTAPEPDARTYQAATRVRSYVVTDPVTYSEP